MTEQNRTEQNRTEQNRTEQNRTEQNRTEQNRTEQNRTEALRKTVMLLENKIINSGDTCLLCFGEIDIRVLSIKMIKDDVAIEESCRNIINNYMEYVDFLLDKGINIIINGPMAAQKDTYGENVQYPRNGTELERNAATLIFNGILMYEAIKRKIPFLTFSLKTIDCSGYSIDGYTNDECHLSQQYYPYAVDTLKKIINAQGGAKNIAEERFLTSEPIVAASPIENQFTDATCPQNLFAPADSNKLACQLTDGIMLGNEELAQLNSYLSAIASLRPRIGAIVMNCNPFTLGHRYLIEQSARKCAQLFIFVVEEDKSDFPFADRIELVRQGTNDISNVTVIPSGKFIISNLTFTDYFGKSEMTKDKIVDPSMDIKLFGQYIAPVMGITIRFAGEEPLDNVTRQYNDEMQRILPQYGVTFEVISRKEIGGKAISASRVRKLLETNDFGEIAKLVPKITLDYLKEKGFLRKR